MRLFLLLPLLLIACSRDPETTRVAAVEAAEQAAAEKNDAIPCARAGQPELQRVCLVERVQGPDGLVLTLRHPDGAFRRLQVTRDGRGVIAADGAEPARVAVLNPGEIEVTIAGDRYRLPATVKGR